MVFFPQHVSVWWFVCVQPLRNPPFWTRSRSPHFSDFASFLLCPRYYLCLALSGRKILLHLRQLYPLMLFSKLLTSFVSLQRPNLPFAHVKKLVIVISICHPLKYSKNQYFPMHISMFSSDKCLTMCQFVHSLRDAKSPKLKTMIAKLLTRLLPKSTNSVVCGGEERSQGWSLVTRAAENLYIPEFVSHSTPNSLLIPCIALCFQVHAFVTMCFLNMTYNRFQYKVARFSAFCDDTICVFCHVVLWKNFNLHLLEGAEGLTRRGIMFIH